jgi:hypothetical protein
MPCLCRSRGSVVSDGKLPLFDIRNEFVMILWLYRRSSRKRGTELPPIEEPDLTIPTAAVSPLFQHPKAAKPPMEGEGAMFLWLFEGLRGRKRGGQLSKSHAANRSKVI